MINISLGLSKFGNMGYSCSRNEPHQAISQMGCFRWNLVLQLTSLMVRQPKP
jgi:hypothetical protein